MNLEDYDKLEAEQREAYEKALSQLDETMDRARQHAALLTTLTTNREQHALLVDKFTQYMDLYQGGNYSQIKVPLIHLAALIEEILRDQVKQNHDL